MEIAFLIVGLILGGIVVWFALRATGGAERASLTARLTEKEQQASYWMGQSQMRDGHIAQLSGELGQIRAQLHAEQQIATKQLATISEAERAMSDRFAALSVQALQQNTSAFLAQAETRFKTLQEQAKGDLDLKQQAVNGLVVPVQQALDKLEGHVREIELARVGAYESIKHHIEALTQTQDGLRSETAQLVRALRAPQVRGRWGELQLKRVVEMAGMQNYCDFKEQQSVTSEDGRLRPDMIVTLPGNKVIVVDAKAPLEAYLDATNAPDDATRKTHLLNHARQVRDHMAKLSQKGYQQQFDQTPEFVVLFLPGEVFFSAALEHDPALIEVGVSQNIILATPTTLIALLKAVAYGWRQESIAQNAQDISTLGRELHKNLSTLAEHWQKMGKNLTSTVEAYNSAVGSLESRVLSKARRFAELKATDDKESITELLPIDKQTRQLRIPDILVIHEENNQLVIEG